MSAPGPTTPAGWHPDPDDKGLLRYWTGSKWTEDRVPAVAPPGVGAATPAGVNQSVPGRSLAIAGFILTLFPIVSVIGVILCAVGGTVSKNAGYKNGWASAGAVVFFVWLGIIVVATVVTAADR